MERIGARFGLATKRAVPIPVEEERYPILPPSRAAE
jgi:hypothetical protein